MTSRLSTSLAYGSKEKVYATMAITDKEMTPSFSVPDLAETEIVYRPI